MQGVVKGSGTFRHFLTIFFLILLCLGAFISTRLPDSSITSLSVNSLKKSIFAAINLHNHPRPHDNPKIPEKPQTAKVQEFPLNCFLGNATQSCPANYYPSNFSRENRDPSSSTELPTCPDYFRWIHEDLLPWRESGITEEMVRMANRTANFRLVILDGKAYLETYQKSFQSRDTFTIWGVLQLLRRYPGQIPDLDLMFDCVDWPVIKKKDYCSPETNATVPPGPPPLFRYCGDNTTLDIVFPDWTYWGWPEINIKPWETLSNDLKEGNKMSKWLEREPYAYWKGNPSVAETRMDLLKCNVSDEEDWSARIYGQDWAREEQQGYKQSDLANQCIHRFKIYIEGSAWSVSEKYILACDSVTLIVKPRYYDFFTRSLMPLQHYWPIRDDDKCRSIKYAVEWGSSNEEKAQSIGKAASSFVQEELKMDYVYDYMFHLLSEYAKLLKYKPTIPPNAIEICSESMVCPALGLEKKFMMEATFRGTNSKPPCVMPPPYDPATLHSILATKENSIKQVETWEKQYWDSKSNHV